MSSAVGRSRQRLQCANATINRVENELRSTRLMSGLLSLSIYSACDFYVFGTSCGGGGNGKNCLVQ